MDIKNILIFFFLFIVAFIIQIISITIIYKYFIKNRTEKNKEFDIKKMELMISLEDYINKIESIIDDLIKRSVETYMILNVSYNNEKYINSEETEQMRNYVFLSVKNNMTDEITSLISTIHVINNESDLDDYLNLKIKLYILAVVVDINKPLQ